MPNMRAFFRFQPSPGYPGYPAFHNELPVPATREPYVMPVRRGDEIRFVLGKPLDVNAATLKIAVATGQSLVLLEAGTLEASQTQLFATVRIPDAFPTGCYRFILYGQADNSTAWAVQSHTCETDSLGRPTGWAEVTESRNSSFVPFALLESNPFQVGPHPETVFAEYTDAGNAFGFLYEDYPGFPVRSFRQKVRLHLALSRPEHTVSESLYRKTDGRYRVQHVQMGKKYRLDTGYLDEPAHDALGVALKHSVLILDARAYASEGVLGPEFAEMSINVRRHPDRYPATASVWDQGFADNNVDCGTDDGIEPPCPNTYVLTVESYESLLETAPQTYAAEVGAFVRMAIVVTPSGGGVNYTYGGDLPDGLAFALVNGKIFLSGTVLAAQSRTVVLKVRNGTNTCGQTTIRFNTGGVTQALAGDYNPADYNAPDYN